MLDVAIFGRHPDLEYGFNGVMSAHEAMGFTAAGCRVHLYLPMTEVHNVETLLSRHKKKSLDELDHFGANFDISILHPGDGPVRHHDVTIWQSYREQDNTYKAQFRRGTGLITKNYPQLLTGNLERDRVILTTQCKTFDLVTFALRSDYVIAQALEMEKQVQYVPRGFNPDWLKPQQDLEVPTIGFDRAIKSDDDLKAIEHIVNVGKRLREHRPNVKFLSLRAVIPELDSKTIRHQHFRSFYEAFTNRTWIYMPVNFMHSAHGVRRFDREDGSWGYRGLYENQIVEAQMAGGIPVMHKYEISPELYIEGETGLTFSSFEDLDEIESKLIDIIDNFKVYTARAREFAITQHNYRRMVDCWIEGIKAIA